MPKKEYSDSSPHIIQPENQRILVRRLTPKETQRLQGFPDNYFNNVPGKSDAKICAAMGNTMTTQVMGWIGKRIDMVDKELKKLKSNPKP